MNQQDSQMRQYSLKEYVGSFLSDYLNKDAVSSHRHIYQLVIHAIEPEILIKVLDHVDGNQTEAARVLGMSRSTLRNKIKKYSLQDKSK